jgi:hypothetical protein
MNPREKTTTERELLEKCFCGINCDFLARCGRCPVKMDFHLTARAARAFVKAEQAERDRRDDKRLEWH